MINHRLAWLLVTLLSSPAAAEQTDYPISFLFRSPAELYRFDEPMLGAGLSYAAHQNKHITVYNWRLTHKASPSLYLGANLAKRPTSRPVFAPSAAYKILDAVVIGLGTDIPAGKHAPTWSYGMLAKSDAYELSLSAQHPKQAPGRLPESLLRLRFLQKRLSPGVFAERRHETSQLSYGVTAEWLKAGLKTELQYAYSPLLQRWRADIYLPVKTSWVLSSGLALRYGPEQTNWGGTVGAVKTL